MFITCQECNTTFRLDESLLKPTGSKVRCSLCHHTFVAKPSAVPVAQMQTAAAAPIAAVHAPPPAPEPDEQMLDGIDLSELDSILEGDGDFSELEAEIAETDNDEALGDIDLDSTENADLDFDFDLDAAFESNEIAAEEGPSTVQSPSDEIDLDMDFEIDDDTLIQDVLPEDVSIEPEAGQPAETIAADSDPGMDDDLDLSLDDLGIEVDEIAENQEASTEAAEVEEAKDDLDLADMEFDMDDSGEAKGFEGEEPELSLHDDKENAALSTDEAEADEFSLDMDFDLDEGTQDQQKEAVTDSSEELSLDLDDGFDLVMDTLPGDDDENAKEPAPVADSEDDGFDLGDLDTLLDAGEDVTAARDDLGDLGDLDELDLDLEMEAPAEEAPAAKAAPEEELEDLDFELDSEFVDNSTMQPLETEASVDTSEDDGEIDLSDIEQMLEGDAPAAPKAPAEPAAQEELSVGGASDELDLSEFESAIDSAGIPDDDTFDEDTELELDLDFDAGESSGTLKEESDDLSLELEMESGSEKQEGDEFNLEMDLSLEDEPRASADQEEALDLSDLSDLVEEGEGAAKSNTIADGDIELEFQIDEEGEPSVEETTVTSTAGTTEKQAEQLQLDQELETLMVEERAATGKPAPAKKKSSKSLVPVFVLLLLLAALCGAAYYAVNFMGVEIPYVSEYLNPKPKDPSGILKLSTMDINSKFVENNQAGRLFVITGKVRNGYSHARNQIRLQGKLFTKGKVLVKSEYSYAGITISDQDLTGLPIAEIKQRLNAGPLSPGAAKGVLPGQHASFIVVFSDLPPADQLDEFAVELISSVKAQ